MSDEYVLRTNSNQTIVIVVEYDLERNTGLVTISASGGKKGLLGLDWGSERAAEKTAEKRIRELIGS
ncbi:MAG: hypothetical protein K9W43_11435 [Candidatus Thorarchaeota archaeon]|nr:hypothetical protein [Candidatus Thorarchaeota archaeon]